VFACGANYFPTDVKKVLYHKKYPFLADNMSSFG